MSSLEELLSKTHAEGVPNWTTSDIQEAYNILKDSQGEHSKRVVEMPAEEVAELWNIFIRQDQIYKHQMDEFYRAIQNCKGMDKWLGQWVEVINGEDNQ